MEESNDKKLGNPNTFEGSIEDIRLRKSALEVEEIKILDRALASENPMVVAKAIREVDKKTGDKATSSSQGRKSYFLDPNDFNDTGRGYKDPPMYMSYGTLLKMSRVPLVSAILKTRKNQIASFARPQEDRFSQGFVVKKKGFEGYSHEMKKEDRKEADRITEFLMRCGENESWSRDDFETFLRKATDDTLIFDQLNFESVRSRKGKLHEFIAVDAATIRIADSYNNEEYEKNKKDISERFKKINGYYPSYVQIHDGDAVADFYPWEMCFGVRNPSTRIYSYNYGRSELEDLHTVITGLLNADKYNSNFFRVGAAPKGLLRIKGGTNNTRISEFRRQWRAMVSGVENCITGDVVIYTREGAVSVEDYLDGKQEKKASIWVGDSYQDGLVYKTKSKKEYCKTVLGNGDSITTSPDHKFRIIDESGDLAWREQKELIVGDVVLVNKIDVSEGTSEDYNDLHEVLGWAIGDGYIATKPKGELLSLFYNTEKEIDVLERHLSILKSNGVNAVKKHKVLSDEEIERIKEEYGFKTVQSERYWIDVFDSGFVRGLLNKGFNKSADGKVIPSYIFTASRGVKRAFLRGLFSADGCNHKSRYPLLSISDSLLRNQVRQLLGSMGVRCLSYEGNGSGRFHTTVGKKNMLAVKDTDLFFREIGFIQTWKQPISIKSKNEGGKNIKVSEAFIIKHLLLIRESIKTGASETCVLTARERNDINAILSGKDGCSYNRIKRIACKVAYELPSWVNEYHFEPVSEVIRTKVLVDMYDVSINEDRHQFIGNNIVTHNSWKTPVLDSESMEWIDLQKNNRDMEFGQYQDHMIKILCALYNIDPSEIGFKSMDSVGGGASMFESSVEHKLKNSKDKGLRPLLKFLETHINKMVVSQINPNFYIEFVGMDEESRKDVQERLTSEVNTYKTVNEVRAEMGYKKLKEGGDILLNPTYASALQQEKMMAASEEQEGGEGARYEDGDAGEMDYEAQMAQYMGSEGEEQPAVQKALMGLEEALSQN